MTPEQLRRWHERLDNPSRILTAVTVALSLSNATLAWVGWIGAGAISTTLAMVWFMVLERVAQRQERSR